MGGGLDRKFSQFRWGIGKRSGEFDSQSPAGSKK